MITNNEKTSLLIPSQLPEFVRDMPDYQNFVTFVQAYYEWLESSDAANNASTSTSANNQGVTYATKNLLSYQDIDKTSEDFLKYFVNDFIPYFPKDSLIDEKSAIKIAKQFYGAKGTPSTFKLLFRLLYDSDFDIFYTKDVVLRASDGQWYVAKSLKLSTSDNNFLNVNNYRLLGETTKSLATIETAVKVGQKTEVFISNIQRLFQSGEFVRVIDSNNQDVLFNGNPLRAKIVGQVSQVKIDPTNRGLLYQVGDPVIFYDGLSSNTGIAATAFVDQVSKGSIQRINVVSGGYGYTTNPNTSIVITGGGATAIVSTLNPDPTSSANATLIPKDTISLKRNIKIGNTNFFFSNIATSDVNTTLINALSFLSFSTYPISSLSLTNSGGGISGIPSAAAVSGSQNDISTLSDISALGMLAPIKILSGGTGYVVNDTINFVGGSGYGAYANVTSVLANGQINTISYVSGTKKYPLGGMGYKVDALPSITVSSSNVLASNASVYVPGILGAGAQFSTVVDRVGSITSIALSENGEDYIATPNVSLKVQDIVVSNVSVTALPQRGDVVYQGTNIGSTTYNATVESITLLTPFNDPKDSLYTFRVFNYNTKPSPSLKLKIDGKNINMNVANVQVDSTFDVNGIKNYGDGTAKATAIYLNGLVVSQGQYLSSRGQPSSYSILQSQDYNNYTYEITVEKAVNDYRDILLNLIHPTGMKFIGKYALKSNSKFNMSMSEATYTGHSLAYYTGSVSSTANVVADFTNKSNNIIQFANLSGANIATFITTGNTTVANSIIEIISPNGPNVKSEVIKLNYTSNTVTLKDNTWLTFANVASISGNVGSNIINILSLTGLYDYINNGQYSNTMYPLMDIVFAGDKLQISNNSTLTVQGVDYVNGKITVTSNLTANSNSLLSVNRTISTACVKIYGPVGTIYT